jgi:CheY-like chemotaxis protein
MMATTVLRILVVDDDPRALHYMHYVLMSAGHDVLSAGHPEEALKLVQGEAVLHVLLADFRMPDMKGTVLGRRLKERHPSLALVFVSADPDTLLRDRDLPQGSVCLAKPATASALLAAVHASLAHCEP